MTLDYGPTALHSGSKDPRSWLSIAALHSPTDIAAERPSLQSRDLTSDLNEGDTEHMQQSLRSSVTPVKTHRSLIDRPMQLYG